MQLIVVGKRADKVRVAIGANQRVRQLETMAVELPGIGLWTGYPVGSAPAFEARVLRPGQQTIGATR